MPGSPPGSERWRRCGGDRRRGMHTFAYASINEVPPAALALFDREGSFGLSRTWFAASETSALPAGARPRYLLCGAEALFPMMVYRGRLRSLTTPYSWVFAPVPEVLTDAAALAFAKACRAWPVTVIEALEAEGAGVTTLRRGLRRAGLLVSQFDHFGNWQESIAGRDWPGYLADRPGRLRELLRRRLRDAGESLRYEMAATPDEVARGLAVYERIYADSWKVPEPFPAFGPALLRAAAAEGTLRLALLWRDETPLAAQYWVLRGGTATVLKLAHAETAKNVSPGSLLTAWAIRRLIEVDGIGRLDFGRGDDAYKQLWATERRQRLGLVACVPWHPVGLAAIGRQALGSAWWALRRQGGGRGGE